MTAPMGVAGGGARGAAIGQRGVAGRCVEQAERGEVGRRACIEEKEHFAMMVYPHRGGGRARGAA
jgi:hypothetical protein